MIHAARFDSFKLAAVCSAVCLVAAAACSGDGSTPAPTGSGGSAAQSSGGTTTGPAGSAGVAGTNPVTGGNAAVGGQAGSATAGSAATTGGSTGSGGGSGSGGANAGAGGQAGGASGAGGTASTAVTPTPTANGYSFTFGEIVLEIDAKVGGRVGKLSLGGTDVIMTSATDPTTWGSVFWTSPRADWTATTNDWPPPVAIDNGAYAASLMGTHVIVKGSADSSLGVSMDKDYSVDAATGFINIAYTINATKALKAAPWEISRVPRGGIVFFPVTSMLVPGPLTITEADGIAWFDDAAKTATSPDGDKCAADGNGWTAYVLGSNLFLKKFADQPATKQAPGEGEVDVYPGAGFLEFEVQGPYTDIPAAGKLPWATQWRVVKVPSSVSIAVKSTALVDFAKQQLGL